MSGKSIRMVFIAMLWATLLLGANVFNTLHWGYLTYLNILLAASLGILFINSEKLGQRKLLILNVVFIAILLFALPGSEGKYQSVMALSGGLVYALIYTIQGNNYVKHLAYCRKWIIIIYLIECGLSIVERILRYNFLSWNAEDAVMMSDFEDASGFRSFGLWGHPLQNALITSTIMGFILMYDGYKPKVKYTLWAIGYAAILCFNTRSSMVGNIIFLALHQVIEASKTHSFSKKLRVIALGLFGVAILALLITQTSLGGRLLEMGLLDENSAAVRMNTWSIFDYYQLSDFLYPEEVNREILLLKTGLYATENFWIDWLLKYGLIIEVIYTALIAYNIFQYGKGYKKKDFIFANLVFWVIASTNNSLTANPIPLFLFLAALVIFCPTYQTIEKT